MNEHTVEKDAPSTPACPSCGHPLTAAYDDTDDSWWECDRCGGCGGSFETRVIPPGVSGD